MFHLLNLQNILTIKQNNILEVAVPYPETFLGILGSCTGTRTLTKVLESATSDKQTEKSYGST